MRLSGSRVLTGQARTRVGASRELENAMPAATFRKIAMVTVATVATTAVVGASAVAAPDGGAAGPRAASVTGSADFVIPFLPDNDVRSFTFDAHGVPYSKPAPNVPTGLPTDARGTVRVSHQVTDQNLTVWWEADVDCLVTDPRGASLTAVITRAHPILQDLIGRRAGFSVYDGPGRDRVGLSWTTVNLITNDKGEYVENQVVGTCMAPAAFAPVVRGGYTVRHADLLPPPRN